MDGKYIGWGIAAAIIVGALIFFSLPTFISEPEHPLGLSSTKLSLEVGDTEDLTVWSLPDGKKYSDISWSSDDESIVSVSGGTITAIKTGTAKITATAGDYRDDCIVTVSDSVEKPFTAYNPYSDRYDYAILSGEGFVGNGTTGGTLALTFNEGGYILISLAGYTWDWYTLTTNALGNPESDFNKINMQILSGDNVIAVSDYSFSTETEYHTFSTVNGITYNSTSCTSVIYAKGLQYGEYTVKFNLYQNSSDLLPLATVTGTFSLCQGDGRFDTTSQYDRSYAWRAAVNDSAKAKQFAMTLTYDYADYWNEMMLSKLGDIHYSNGLQNHKSVNEMPGFCVADSSVVKLQAALKEKFLAAFPTLPTDGQEYAQFLLSFVQISKVYEYDYAQNYNCTNHLDATDVWAFPSMTLYTGMGDCEDTSILLDTLYRLAGYGSGLIVLDDHVMGSVCLDSCTNYGTDASIDKAVYHGKKYFLCETTCISPVFFKKTTGSQEIYTYSASFDDKLTIQLYSHSYRLVGCVVGTLYEEYQFLELP